MSAATRGGVKAVTDVRSPLPRFLRALRALLAQVPSTDAAATAERARVVSLLGDERWGEVLDAPTQLPVTRHLTEILAGIEGPAAAVAEAIQAAAGALPWAYSYPPRADPPDLRERIAFAEILGPTAPLRCDTHCLGLTLIAPETLYPLHHHPAVELYLVLSGTARWTAAGRTRAVPPLELVLHPSSVPHAMQTGAAPLLAAYAWTGSDVRTTSVYLDPRR